MADLPKLRIVYYSEEVPPDVVIVGQWEVGQAEGKFDVLEVHQGSVRSLSYQAFLAARRHKLVPEGMTWEKWDASVALIESADDEGDSGESQAPLAT